jgi:Ca2+-binding RTX toxin-like protein
MLTGTNGTPTISAANLTKLDGGAGSDTLSFEESSPATDTELTLTTAGATNFENLTGGSNAEVLKGDNNANILKGKGGADTLYGYGGNDTLNAGSGSTNDILYGGAGNDTLLGTDGDNTLDGGTGADTITSGGAVDTFVLRVGSGGSAITDADTFKDFTDGTDLIGLDNGLAFGDLTIEQGAGSYSSHTIIKAGSEYLAVVENMTASDLTESSFTPVNITESGTENAQLILGNAMIDNGSLDLDFSGVTASPSLSINLSSAEMNETDFNFLIEADDLTFELETDFINLPPSSENAPQEIEDFVQYENLFSEALITLEEEDFLFVSMDL